MKYKSVIILFLLVACAYVGIGKENKQYIILSFTFEEPIIKKITIFNKTYEQFQSYLVGISPPEYDFEIKKGMGIFIYTTKESIWYG